MTSVAQQGKDVAQDASSKAQETAGSAAGAAKDVTAQAREQATHLTHQATEQARGLVGDATGQLREHASTQTERLAQGLRSGADQVRALIEGRSDEAGQAKVYAEQAGDKLASIADRLENEGLDGISQDLTDLARRRPGAFLLGAGVLGFAAGRLLKGAKAANEQQSSQASLPSGGSYGSTQPGFYDTGYPAAPSAPTIPSSPAYPPTSGI